MTAKADTKPIRAELEKVAQPSKKRDIIELIQRNELELKSLLEPVMTATKN